METEKQSILLEKNKIQWKASPLLIKKVFKR